MRTSYQTLLALFCVSCSSNENHTFIDTQPFQTYNITNGLLCEPPEGLLGCLRAHEPILEPLTGAQSGGRDSGLCLPSLPEATCFIDQDGLGYALLGRTGDRFLIVETDATGGYSVIILDALTGSQRHVDNRPLPSASGTLFATVSYDTDAGYIPNRVAIWDEHQPGVVYEVNDFATGQGPTGIQWVGPSRLAVRYSRQPQQPEPDKSGTFYIWRDAEGVWNNDYSR